MLQNAFVIVEKILKDSIYWIFFFEVNLNAFLAFHIQLYELLEKVLKQNEKKKKEKNHLISQFENGIKILYSGLKSHFQVQL